IDHAGHPASTIGIDTGLVGADYPSATLDDHVFFATSHFGGEGDFKLYWGTDIQRGIGADVHTRGAQIPRHAAGFAGGVLLVNFDRQFERESLTGPGFGHNLLRCGLAYAHEPRATTFA